jgi:hypothetical protein
MLDREGIPGGTVGHTTARIGDGLDAYRSGVLTHVNETARAAGLEAGTALRAAVERLLASACNEVSQARGRGRA